MELGVETVRLRKNMEVGSWLIREGSQRQLFVQSFLGRLGCYAFAIGAEV